MTYRLRTDVIPVEERQIYEGWNFVGITPDMIGDNTGVEALAGDCNISRSYTFVSDGQEWQEFPLDEEFSSDAAGYTWVIKVDGACNLEMSLPVIPPFPVVPELPVLPSVNLLCFDAISALDIEEGDYTYANSSSEELSLQVLRGAAGYFELSGIQVIIDIDGNSYTETLRDNLPEVNEAKVSVLTSDQVNYGSATSVGIAPIIVGDDGEEVCDVSSNVAL